MGDSIFGGQLDTSLQTDTDGKTVADVLQDFGNDIQDDLRNSLEILNHEDTHALWQSIEFRVGFEGLSGFVFTLSYDDYGIFLDEGVEGVGGKKADGTQWRKRPVKSPFSFKNKRPPVKQLAGWAYRKKLNPFAVSESIFHRGIENSNWYSSVVTQKRIDELSENLAKAGASELQIIIKDAFEE